ncbi:hypothetical protein C8Q80DRAFT_1092190 [Daedaleopsis nitida]|nr:hypothetical protein C8Q80DRAFT_1092190 [Daedaleopsis nitida]
MADAKARAEARRKAILARGGDRLAKITTSGRGEEGAAYMRDSAYLASPMPNRDLSNFVGETSDMPTPPASMPGTRNASGAHPSSFSAAGLGAAAPDPSVWSEEQQQQFMNALMGAAASGNFPGAGPEQPRSRLASASSSTAAPSSTAGSSTAAPPSVDDPMAALMSALQQGGGGAPPGFQFPGAGVAPAQAAPKRKTVLQKLMPIVHIVCAWALLAYFVIRREPEVHEAQTHGAVSEGVWRRWAELSWKAPEDSWSVQTVPFFWAFTTLALVLHTWRIFTRLDPIQPPMLLALALPHLPPPLPAIVTNGLKYLQIGGVFFDDISALIVGTGFLIWLANLVVA